MFHDEKHFKILTIQRYAVGVEIKIMSMNKDNYHSWVRISHSLNKVVTNLNNNAQEVPEVQFEEYALKLNASDFACQ